MEGASIQKCTLLLEFSLLIFLALDFPSASDCLMTDRGSVSEGHNNTTSAQNIIYQRYTRLGDYFLYAIGLVTLSVLAFCCVVSKTCALRSGRQQHTATTIEVQPKEFILTRHPPSYISADPPPYTAIGYPAQNIDHTPVHKPRTVRGGGGQTYAHQPRTARGGGGRTYAHQVIVESLSVQPHYDTSDRYLPSLLRLQGMLPQTDLTSYIIDESQSMQVQASRSGSVSCESQPTRQGDNEGVISDLEETSSQSTIQESNRQVSVELQQSNQVVSASEQQEQPLRLNVTQARIHTLQSVQNEDISPRVTDPNNSCNNFIYSVSVQRQLSHSDDNKQRPIPANITPSVTTPTSTEVRDSYVFVSEPGLHPEMEVGLPPAYTETLSECLSIGVHGTSSMV